MVRDRDRGRRGPTRLFEDAGGQQFVLEAAVVAILMVSTIVIVANVTPTGPGIEQPETHQRMRRSAQDVLDAMAAETVPACRTVQVETVDGSMVSRRICSKSSQLVADLLKSMMANSTVLCDKAGKDVPDGTRVAVYVHGSLGSTRVCGEVVDASTPGGSVAAFYATSMAFNYTHVFTDLDAYNGNDPTALGNTVTSQANVHTTETRALQRVITVPTRRGWPVVPGGEALRAEATLEGGPVAGDRVMTAA